MVKALRAEFAPKFSTVLLKCLWKRPAEASNIQVNTDRHAVCTTIKHIPWNSSQNEIAAGFRDAREE
jgi:hypothetical protein